MQHSQIPLRRVGRGVLSFFATALMLSAPASTAFAADGAVPRLAIADEPAGAAIKVLDDTGAIPFPVVVNVTSATFPTDAALDGRLAALESRHVPVWLTVPAPATEPEVDAWRAALRAVVEKHGAALHVVEIAVDRQGARVAAFAVQVAATDVRTHRDTIQIALGGPAMNDAARREELYRTELAPYVDLLATSNADAATSAWLHRVDSSAAIAVTASAADSRDSVRRLVDGTLQELGTDVALHAWPSAVETPAALRALVPVADLLTDEISVLDAAVAGLSLHAAAADITATLPHRLLFDGKTFATYLVYWGDAAPERLRMTLVLPVEGVPGVHDVIAGARSSAANYSREQATGRVQADAPLTGRPMVVDFNEGATDVMVERASVSAEKALSVAEVIARHQQQQRAQDAIVKSYIAHARMQQHFRPTATDSYDVPTENRYFVAGREEELHWLALKLIPGLGTRIAGRLIAKFRTPMAVFRASLTELESAQTVLLAGAGGGFDIFSGLPLYFGLRKARSAEPSESYRASHQPKREDVMSFRVVVDFDKCESNALCMGVAPEVFEVREDDFLYVLQEQPPDELRDKCNEAARVCPKQAITIEDT